MESGVKQGAIESPAFFSIVAEICFAEAEERFGWSKASPQLPGLDLRDILFMDDSILWDTKCADLERRTNQLAQVFGDWGLELNAEKCQWYKSPHAEATSTLTMGGKTIVPVDALEVMGVKMTVGMTLSEMIGPVFTGFTLDRFSPLTRPDFHRNIGSGKRRAMWLGVPGEVGLWEGLVSGAVAF